MKFLEIKQPNAEWTVRDRTVQACIASQARWGQYYGVASERNRIAQGRDGHCGRRGTDLTGWCGRGLMSGPSLAQVGGAASPDTISTKAVGPGESHVWWGPGTRVLKNGGGGSLEIKSMRAVCGEWVVVATRGGWGKG